MNIILKTDDFRASHSLHKGSWLSFLDIILKYNCKISLGFIGIGLENTSLEQDEWVKEAIYRNIVQPFNHSYWHLLEKDKREFKNTERQYQIDSLYKTQTALKKKLDYVNTCFGSVGNSIDFTAARILEYASDIKYVYVFGSRLEIEKFSIQMPSKILIPINGHNYLEHKEDDGNCVSFARFVAFYSKYENKNTIVYQLHPANWNAFDLNEFEKIVEWLIKKENKFIFPSEYR